MMNRKEWNRRMAKSLFEFLIVTFVFGFMWIGSMVLIGLFVLLSFNGMPDPAAILFISGILIQYAAFGLYFKQSEKYTKENEYLRKMKPKVKE